LFSLVVALLGRIEGEGRTLMVNGRLSQVLGQVRRLFSSPAEVDSTDADLLGRFVASRDGEAFTALLDRHGAMVWDVCRNVLRDPHDAEDAFQATFLVLARKPGSVRKRDSLASWLYGTAYRLAIRQRQQRERRRPLHDEAALLSPSAPAGADMDSLRPWLHDEIGKLPERFRAPLVLCYLEGKTNEEAARELGWPAGSMSRRLAQARDLLRDRLAARGEMIAGPALLAALSEPIAAAPRALFERTLADSLAFAAAASAELGARSSALTLAHYGLRRLTMIATFKITAAAALTGALILGGWSAAHHGGSFVGSNDPSTDANTGGSALAIALAPAPSPMDNVETLAKAARDTLQDVDLAFQGKLVRVTREPCMCKVAGCRIVYEVLAFEGAVPLVDKLPADAIVRRECRMSAEDRRGGRADLDKLTLTRPATTEEDLDAKKDTLYLVVKKGDRFFLKSALPDKVREAIRANPPVPNVDPLKNADLAFEGKLVSFHDEPCRCRAALCTLSTQSMSFENVRPIVGKAAATMKIQRTVGARGADAINKLLEEENREGARILAKLEPGQVYLVVEKSGKYIILPPMSDKGK